VCACSLRTAPAHLPLIKLICPLECPGYCKTRYQCRYTTITNSVATALFRCSTGPSLTSLLHFFFSSSLLSRLYASSIIECVKGEERLIIWKDEDAALQYEHSHIPHFTLFIPQYRNDAPLHIPHCSIHSTEAMLLYIYHIN